MQWLLPSKLELILLIHGVLRKVIIYSWMKVVCLIFQHLYKAQKNTKGSLKLNTFWIRLCFFFLKASRGDTQLVMMIWASLSTTWSRSKKVGMRNTNLGKDKEFDSWGLGNSISKWVQVDNKTLIGSDSVSWKLKSLITGISGSYRWVERLSVDLIAFIMPLCQLLC